MKKNQERPANSPTEIKHDCRFTEFVSQWCVDDKFSGIRTIYIEEKCEFCEKTRVRESKSNLHG